METTKVKGNLKDPAVKAEFQRQLVRAWGNNLKKDLAAFAKEAFKQLHNGKEVIWNWHLEYLCDVLQKEAERIFRGEPKTHDIIINVPPRSLKSELVSCFFPAWCYTRQPDFKTISVSYVLDIAGKMTLATKELMLTPWYKQCFPEVSLSKYKQTTNFFRTSQGGMRMAAAVGGRVTGEGADILICDDLISPTQALSDAERGNCIDFFTGTLPSRINHPDVGMFILIAQRVHAQDPIGFALGSDPDRWFHINLPAEIDENNRDQVRPKKLLKHYDAGGGLMFPKLFSKKILSNFRKDLGSLQYSCQYLQNPIAAGGNIFKRAWFESVQEFHHRSPMHFVIDTAYGRGDNNDFTALLAYFIHDNILYIQNIHRVKMDFPDLCNFIPAWVEANRYSNRSMIHIEKKATGESVAQVLKKQTMLNIKFQERPKNVGGRELAKIQRAHAVSPIIESGRVRLVSSINNGLWIEPFMFEVTGYPNNQHDDQVDVMMYAIQNLMKYDKTKENPIEIHSKATEMIKVEKPKPRKKNIGIEIQ